MSKLKVGIVDYGIGNQTSILNCIKSIGFKGFLTDEIEILNKTDLLILPGVGAFEPTMRILKKKNLDKYLIDQGNKNKPIIGICLGMQLLGKTSSEKGMNKGLDLIPGRVDILSDEQPFHIGWNSLKILKNSNLILDEKNYFYFNHSYAFKEIRNYSICSSNHAGIKFNSIIRKNNIVGIQFHPEKSQKAGRNFLKNLIKGLCDA